MNKQNMQLAFLSSVALFVFIACTLTSTTTTVPGVPGAPETIAAKTWSAILTSTAKAVTPSNTPLPATETPLPSDTPTITLTPTASRTPVPLLTAFPTNTPQPTATITKIPTVTPIPGGIGGGGSGGGGSGGGGGSTKPCLAAKLVRHITIPDGQVLPTGQFFAKVWRIQNTGTCTWDSSIYFTPVGGFDPLFGSPIPLPQKVKPGKTIDLMVNLLTPNAQGNITGQWVFRSDGESFGNNGSTPFRVNVNVVTSLPNPLYDFASRSCVAFWQSNVRMVNGRPRLSSGAASNLNCNGRVGNPIGFVVQANNPNTEAGTINAPGLWTNPPRMTGGITQGVYPAMLIFSGDRFQAQVGCLNGAGQCNVSFEIRYQVIIPPNTVSAENSFVVSKVYDGTLQNFDLDLSGLGLSGQYVSFIFRVLANNDSDENAAIWVAPALVH